MPNNLDPNALAVLLRGQPASYAQYGEDQSLSEMIPEESLFQAQEAIGAKGAGGDAPYFVPSRESLQKSGVSKLKRLFGLERAKGQAAAYPAQVKGQYDYETTGLKGRYDVEAARTKAEAEIAERRANQEFQQAQQGRGQAFSGEQNRMGREQTAANTKALIEGRQGTAEEATRRSAATQRSIDLRKSGGENKYWGPDAIMEPLWRLLGGGPDPAIEKTLAPYRNDPRFADLPFDEFAAATQFQADTPEEEAAYRQAWGK